MYAKTAAVTALPFTGLALGWYAALGLLMLFVGVGLIQTAKRHGAKP